MLKRMFSVFYILFFIFVFHLAGVPWTPPRRNFIFTRPALANEEKVTLYFFWSKTCPHCHEERLFLDNLIQKYPNLEIKDYEITTEPANGRLLRKIGQELKINISGVPFTAVGEYHFTGFLSDETTGQQIEEAVECAFENSCQDVVGEVINGSQKNKEAKIKIMPESFKLPLIGEIKTKNLSLPILTLVIALLDGFNPCAMWVLLFLISLLLGMKDRKRMRLLGTTFIVASGVVYFLFMTAWLNLFLFLGFVFWVRLLIGLTALTAGGINLRSYWLNRSGCDTIGEAKRNKIFDRMKTLTQKKQLWLALVGLVGLAFAVNLIELVCSAGLPAIYTQILSLSKLAWWQHYSYLLLYTFIFMADDLLVFFIAMTTLKAVGIESKYSRWSKLIGGVLMLIIGLLLLFKPGILMF